MRFFAFWGGIGKNLFYFLVELWMKKDKIVSDKKPDFTEISDIKALDCPKKCEQNEHPTRNSKLIRKQR
ncbi:hypothetical protein [Acinetobacter johnsonii]|uniref:hypothetical protein n=1 Tax=Acinetobacter johnsonii TaxID=40214 RepID=UPI0029368387|nr:hypothetical protein [Acinetobacter johnsonii]MDV2487659.1 hypothetical protein [Acinetobacter johnsonii]